MAIGPDRVQLLKDESTSGGGDPADVGPYGNPTPIEPQEDAIESAGVYLQDAANRDEEVYIYRDGDNMVLRDVNNPAGRTLSSLGGGAGASDHGALTGLADDDHLQYLTEARHDALPADNPHNVTYTQVGADQAGTAASLVAAHEAAADPHTQYQLRSEKSTANGYASLDGTGRLPLSELSVHAATHLEGGSDVIDAHLLGSNGAPADYFMVTDGTGGWVLQEAPAEAFGTQQHREEDVTSSSTSSATFQTKITLTTGALPAGDYLVFYKMLVIGSANGTTGEVQLEQDGSIIVDEQGLISGAANNEQGFTGLDVLSLSGVHEFRLQYRKSGGSGTVSVRRARILLYRIK